MARAAREGAAPTLLKSTVPVAVLVVTGTVSPTALTQTMEAILQPEAVSEPAVLGVLSVTVKSELPTRKE